MLIRGLTCACILALGLGLASAQEAAPPPAADATTGKGLIMVEVKFAADGTVAACRIMRSNVPYVLESSTIDYVRRKWVNAFFANETVLLPITFDELPWYAKSWMDGLTPPPNFLPPGDPGRKLKLRVTFGPNGWVQRVELKEPSGLDIVDRDTAIWIKVHWHDVTHAGQTLDAPFIFKTPATPKQVVAKTPSKPKPKPVAPEEPAAAPAVRVE
jgi:hypothetical protein